MNRHLTARCRIVQNGKEALYQFFCDLSGALICSMKEADSPEDAWESGGREHFNRCRRCGRWVCDTMYNPDTLQCVDCSPWEEQPSFCPQCGAKVTEDAQFCRDCHARLRYGEEVNAYEGAG